MLKHQEVLLIRHGLGYGKAYFGGGRGVIYDGYIVYI